MSGDGKTTNMCRRKTLDFVLALLPGLPKHSAAGEAQSSLNARVNGAIWPARWRKGVGVCRISHLFLALRSKSSASLPEGF